MEERALRIGSRSVMVRDAGDPDGVPVLYFHGTPGSRLDGQFAEDAADGVRVISFDRPGYGRSDPAPFALRSVADDAEAIADSLGLGRVATLGWSGGGPFALTAGAVMGDRVVSVGVACGPGPFQQVPGALEGLDAASIRALSLLPDRAEAAAEGFCAGSELMMAVRDDEQAFMIGMDALFGAADASVLADPVLRHHLFVTLNEGLWQGFLGVGWDNVSWVGPWDIDLGAVRCPVHLWYGAHDEAVSLDHGKWLSRHLVDAKLVVRQEEGHLGPMRHWQEMLQSLVVTAGSL